MSRRHDLVDLALVVFLGGGMLAVLAWCTACDDEPARCAFDAPPACEPAGQPPSCDDDGCCSCPSP